jgi:transcriptional regulator with XRE-family HTH domain
MTTSIKKAYRGIPARSFLEDLIGGPLTFSELILTLRQNEELSQKDFSAKLGISKQKLCDIEKGRRSVSPAKAAQFALKLKYPPDVFVELVLQDEFKREGVKVRLKVKAA